MHYILPLILKGLFLAIEYRGFPLSPPRIGKHHKQRLPDFFYPVFTQILHKMKSKFTIPKLNKSSKYWYAHYRYEGVQFRETWQLNKITNLKERESSYNDYCKMLLKDLESGWNPNIPDAIQSQSDMFIVESLRFALEKKKESISKRTHSSYEGTVNFIEKSIKLLGIEYLKIAETKRAHLKLVMEKCKSENKWTNKSYNKHLNHLKAVLSELIQWEAIENNPAFNIKNLPTEESIAHVPPTDQEMEVIISELIKNHYNFYIYISLIDYWAIRPIEILNIKLSDIDMSAKIVTLRPINTKGRKKYRILPIMQFIYEDFLKMDFENLPKDYFLFGSFREPGKGNIGKFKDFISAPTHLNRDTATKRWNKIVKIGLGIDVTMYSMKKYGANRKQQAGISIDAIQDEMGHSEKETTKIYLTNKSKIYRQEIIDKTTKIGSEFNKNIK